jgi:hypothetical protein
VERHHDRAEGARGERDVCGIEGEPQLAPGMLGEKSLRVLLTGLIGEPVLVVGHGAGTDGRDQALQGHLMGIAEGEVGDAGCQPPLPVPRLEIEVLDGREGRGRGPDPVGNRHACAALDFSQRDRILAPAFPQ